MSDRRTAVGTCEPAALAAARRLVPLARPAEEEIQRVAAREGLRVVDVLEVLDASEDQQRPPQPIVVTSQGRHGAVPRRFSFDLGF